MITCNSCGELVQAGLANCQHCGMPVSSADQAGRDSEKSTYEYSDLPAWLESLRVNEQLSSPANEQPFFSSADLVDEGGVPSWMRPDNAELMGKGDSGKYAAWRPAWTPAPNTGDEIVPPKRFHASSLIDEQSLPTWIQGNQQHSQAPGFSAPDTQRNFSAASLIQPDALPDWMNSLSPSSQPAAPYNSVWGDEQPLDNNQVRINSFAPDSSGIDSNSPPQGFSAHDLIDPQAIPQWMAGQYGQQAGSPPDSPSHGAQEGLPASSLLDVNSLPVWLHENEHAQSSQIYSDLVKANPPGQPGLTPGVPGGLTAASLIDVTSLPAWLSSPEVQEQTGMPAMGDAHPVRNGMSPRFDNLRVPSRPRGEMIAHEQSEVAANVFSSMLGVASSAPYFPSAGMQSNAPSQPSGFAGAPPAQAYNPAGYQGAQQGAYHAGAYAGPGGFPQGGQPAMARPPQAYGPGMPPEPSTAGQRLKTNAPGSKPAKRGIIETIRSWFS